MTEKKKSLVDQTKELLEDHKDRIRLDDFATDKIKIFLKSANPENFPVQGIASDKEVFIKRLNEYENVVADLQKIVTLIAHWGEGKQINTLEKIIKRTSEANRERAGIQLWLRLRWYPMHILIYSAGMSALSARNYYAFKTLLTTPVKDPLGHKFYYPIIETVSSNIYDIHDYFGFIEEHKRYFSPISEYLNKILKSPIDNLLFLGDDYDRVFDDYEVYAALTYIDVTNSSWGPIGRFGYKYSHDVNSNPFKRILEEGEKYKEKWHPIEAGMFNHSYDRFLEVSKVLEERLSKIPWY